MPLGYVAGDGLELGRNLLHALSDIDIALLKVLDTISVLGCTCTAAYKHCS